MWTFVDFCLLPSVDSFFSLYLPNCKQPEKIRTESNWANYAFELFVLDYIRRHDGNFRCNYLKLTSWASIMKVYSILKIMYHFAVVFNTEWLCFTTRFWGVEVSYIDSNWEKIEYMKRLTLTDPTTAMHLMGWATCTFNFKLKWIASLFTDTLLLTMRLLYCQTDFTTKH